MTGAFSPFCVNAVPSFILIEYKNGAKELTLYVYKYIMGSDGKMVTDIG